MLGWLRTVEGAYGRLRTFINGKGRIVLLFYPTFTAQTLKTLLSQGSINIAIILPALFKQRPLHHKGSEG